ncbi:phytanoyl-CoA dioxygenase family protein [Cyanobium sp. FGCU-6]|nr:phytanoyl-CoA dioxygenase family protein [Cyanobium sp. FGCU6]
MKFFEFPAEELAFFSQPGQLEGSRLSLEVLDRAGVFVVQGLLPAPRAATYLEAYEAALTKGSAKARQNHLTEVSFELDNPLAKVLFEPEFAALAAQIFEHGAGLHNIRVVRKDENNREPVFVHQDSPYCLGFFERYSAFLALTPCGTQNGGLFVHPGTHHLGYLGDAGEIHTDLTSQLYRFMPELGPGDCLLMHSAIWHGSTRHETSVPRVMYDIQIQPVVDPSSIMSLCERPLSKWRLRLENKEIFSTSRIQRGTTVSK